MCHRYLVSLILFSTLALADGQGHPQAKSPDKTAHTNEQGTQNTPPPVQSSAPPPAAKAGEEQNRPDQKPHPWLTHGEWVMAGLTFIYVLLTGFYAWTSHKTLTAIEGQAEQATREAVARDEQFAKQLRVAEDAAKTASLNAQAFINAERPWVMIQIKETPEDKDIAAYLSSLRSFQLNMFNFGKTPAHVLNCRVRFDVCENPDATLPLPPDYGTGEWERKFLAPRDSLLVTKTFEPSRMKLEISAKSVDKEGRIKNGELIVYGLIEYSDGVSSTVYRTPFCFRHEKMALSTMGGHLFRCGPRVYNEYN